MAITKIFAVRHHLFRIISYAANQDKTSLDAIIQYATNEEKNTLMHELTEPLGAVSTEQRIFESVLNCESPSTACAEMMHTKKKWHSTGCVLAYHFIQSFEPGEVTPEQAHDIGVEFARRMFGERFEVVVGTHLDRAHLHNHIVINSVSFVDGRKYHSSPGSYYFGVRGTSDELCRENGLSVIDHPKGHGKHYSECQAEQQGKPTIRQMIRDDIDDIISQSYTFQSFIKLLQSRGYQVRAGNRKHIAIIPPFGDRPIRLDSLKGDYTEEAIRERLQRQRETGTTVRPDPPKKTIKRYRYRGKLQSRTKLHGFRALYFRYLYLLGKVRKRQYPRKASRLLMDEAIKFKKYVAQHQYLIAHQIDTTQQLAERSAALQDEIKGLMAERQPLYRQQKQAPELAEKIKALTRQLRGLRKEARICAAIQTAAPHIQARYGQAQKMQDKPHKQKDAIQRSHVIKRENFQ